MITALPGGPLPLPPQSLPLPHTQLHLWLCRPDNIRDPALLERYAALLTPIEQAAVQRYVTAPLRHQALVTRALQRTVLSHYAPIDPAAWRFKPNQYGRPAISGPHNELELRFNLSHANGLIVCLVGLDRELGVDVEDADREQGGLHLSQRFFSPVEHQQLVETPEPGQKRRFFEFWTLKEAYIKARGMGLHLPLEQFSFLLRPDELPVIRFHAGLEDDPSSWSFLQLRPTSSHELAIAARSAGHSPLELRSWWVVPLESAQPVRLEPTHATLDPRAGLDPRGACDPGAAQSPAERSSHLPMPTEVPPATEGLGR